MSFLRKDAIITDRNGRELQRMTIIAEDHALPREFEKARAALLQSHPGMYSFCDKSEGTPMTERELEKKWVRIA